MKDETEYSQNTIDLQPKKLNTRHRSLMRKLLAGVRLNDAADELGMNVQRASLVVNSPLFQDEMKRMSEEINHLFVQCEGEKVHQDNIRVRLKDEANASLNTLLQLRDGARSERVRQLSAIEILDRAGYKPSDKIEGEITIEASDGLVNALRTAMEKKDELPKQ